MKKYPKIQTIFKRDINNKGKLIEGMYSCPEFDYLKHNTWTFTEKVDGTNIRIEWHKETGITIGGRTDNAQIPALLYAKLTELFGGKDTWDSIDKTDHLTLFGEGYGAKIQKGGGNYLADDVSFVLFDVLVDDYWLSKEIVDEIAHALNIKTVPTLGEGFIGDAINMAEAGFLSKWGDFKAEGIVLRPKVELINHNGHRIIAKIKHKDFLV